MGEAGSPGFDVHDKVSKTFDDVVFGHTFDKAVMEHYKPEESFVLFKAFDEGRNDLKGDVTVETVK